jgi:hypothetical protein
MNLGANMSPIVNHLVPILPLGITIGGRFLGFKNKFTSKFGHHTLLWDMKNNYGATKKPH